MCIEKFIHSLKQNLRFASNIVVQQSADAEPPEFVPMPEYLPDTLSNMLQKRGISRLYRHQAEALAVLRAGQNLLLSTSVASGKSLVFQLHILMDLLLFPQKRALLLFPTKALAQDQFKSFATMLASLGEGYAKYLAVYDGDTPASKRRKIREEARILISNPDMLHLGVLPHHPKWRDFFSNLQTIVVDEMHIYRGVFGSHFANIVRRLRRISTHYGTGELQFVLNSASIRKADAFAKKLCEHSFRHVWKDYSGKGPRHSILYNPPLLDEELGIRSNPGAESLALAEAGANADCQTLLFVASRRMVELFLRQLKALLPQLGVEGYRSGYLPEERRQIESRFREGIDRVLISTNAMELGVDVGGLDLVITNTYPGSMASLIQQSGRAGRQKQAALFIFVAGNNPVDQFFMQHSEYLLRIQPEAARIDPDNPFILFQHIQCSNFELPFAESDSFGQLSQDTLKENLELMLEAEMAVKSSNKVHWNQDSYPADAVSLRSASSDRLDIRCEGESIGMVDRDSSLWLCHPGAVYLHAGETYFVEDLDLENNRVELSREERKYYTQAMRSFEFSEDEREESEQHSSFEQRLSYVTVTSQVTGFKKIAWGDNLLLDADELELPPTELFTEACIFLVADEVVNILKTLDLWTSYDNNYGKEWPTIRREILARDKHCCRSCGTPDLDGRFHVHHIEPLKKNADLRHAHRRENLLTLCPACHKKAEQQVAVQGTLSGLAFLLGNLAPVFLLCDRGDITCISEAKMEIADKKSALIFFDMVPGGIGLSAKLYEILPDVLEKAEKIVRKCPCKMGCPACVGPVAENAVSAKNAVAKLIQLVLRPSVS